MVSPGSNVINYIIAGVLCISNIQSTNLCFNVSIPLKFKTLAECDFKMNNLMDILGQDFRKRGIYLVTKCVDENKIYGKNIIWTTTD